MTHDVAAPDARLASVYVPRILQQHLVDDPGRPYWTGEGTAAFCDVSGFTRLSERLARKGREGAEQIADEIGRIFEAILEVAYAQGGSLLKFGGDALLLWFEGDAHATRAARATILMRRVLRDVGRIEAAGRASVTLRMSQAVHSGAFHFFAVGTTHHEFLTTGPAWSRLVVMEHVATAGEIVISTETASRLPPSLVGETRGPGFLLQREPPGRSSVPLVARPAMAGEALARCLPLAVRAHVLAGGGTAELRAVSIAFIKFEGIDEIIAREGPAAAADALQRVVSVVEAATEARDVALLASDVDVDGGKLILAAGAPKGTGDDEERMLLALHAIATAQLPLPIRIGVHRGSVFAGDIGPFYRRTYTVMGDAVNLAARVMGKAPTGKIYATASVLERSNTRFAAIELTPFAVKGKTQPVQAYEVGKAIGSRSGQVSLQELPLLGREAELATMGELLAAARAGRGRLLEIAGEVGVGKSRLLAALRDAAEGFGKCDATCEAYTAATPYVAWRELLRDALSMGRDESEETIVERLRDTVSARAPELAPWLPLLAAVFEIEIAATPEVAMLADKNRRAKLHEVVTGFLAATLPPLALLTIDNAQHMDEASAALLLHLTTEVAARSWVIAVARRPEGSGFAALEGPAVVKVALEPIDAKAALRIVQKATEQHPLPMHVLEVVATRCGGNPAYLRDLLRSAIQSGSAEGLPDSAEAAATARIDALAPSDRALLRRAAVFGLTFHPRMLDWLADDDAGTPVDNTAAFGRLRDFFEEDDGGYLRFRRSLLRDAAYEGLTYKLRRRLHRAAAVRCEADAANPEDFAGVLALHYFVAGEYDPAWRYGAAAARRAAAVYAYVEAAELFARALEASRRLPELPPPEVAAVYESLGDAWNLAGDFRKASDAYTDARKRMTEEPLRAAGLLLKRSRIEEKLGRYPQALRWAGRARKALEGQTGLDASRRSAQVNAWYAIVLQAEGRYDAAMQWAERAIAEAEKVDEPDALGAACFVIGWSYAMLGKPGWEAMVQRSLAAYERSGDRVKQAGILSNVGVVCQGEGRWDEAMSYYERSRDECQKIGSVTGAATARINMAEILIDRGEVDEAEAILHDVLPLWRGAKYRYFLGGCLSLLGRAAARAGRIDEALRLLEDAKGHFVHVGAAQDALAIDARIAACLAFKGEPDAALELAGGTLARSGASGATMVVPQTLRVRGYALWQKGDRAGARAALAASLAAGRERRDSHEVMLTLYALRCVDRDEGVATPRDLVDESESLRTQLRVRQVPVPSFFAQ